jgi:thioredoxin-like negative regulator of GroEL
MSVPLLVALLVVQDAAMDWKKDYEAALKEAQKSERFVVVHFGGPGCPPGKKMDEVTYTSARVIEHSNRSFVNVRVFLDRENPLAEQFGVQAIPVTFLVTAEGARVRKWEGYLGPQDYIKGLDQAVTAHRGLREIELALRAEPESFELNRKLGGYLEDLGQARKAADALKKAAAKAALPKVQAELLSRAISQLYDVEIDEALNDEILAIVVQLERADADGALGRRGDALAARAQVAMNREKPSEAIRYFEEIVEKHPASDKAPVSLLWLGELYHHHLKDGAKAEKALRRILEKYPKSDVAPDARAMLEHLKEHSEK